jgi:CheY-like chemotaxis protein
MGNPPRRILCVEDDPDSSEMMTALLQTYDSSYIVASAASVDEAKAKFTSESFDLIILDNWLTDESGIELCRWIRKAGNKSPVLFFTADASEAAHRDMMAAGADALLIKPHGLDKLKTRVKLLQLPPIEPAAGGTTPNTPGFIHHLENTVARIASTRDFIAELELARERDASIIQRSIAVLKGEI